MPDVDRTEVLTNKIINFLNLVLRSEHTQDFEYVTQTEKIWFTIEDGFFGLSDEAARKYRELTDAVLRMNPWERISQKYIQNHLDDIYLKSLSDTVRAAGSRNLSLLDSATDVDSISEQVKALVADLDRQASEEWTVYLPLSGIKRIAGNSLKIGNACLRYMTSADTGALSDEVEAIVRAKYETKAQQNGYLEVWRSGIERLKDTVCAIFQIAGEADKALESAEEQTRDILDLLTYFLSYEHSRGYRGAIRLQGEMAASRRTTFLISFAKTLHLGNELTGPYLPVELTDENIAAMQELGICNLSKIIEKGQLTEFQKTVFSGIRWFAASQRQNTPEIEFANLITCLETCLTQGNNPIGATIAEGCAILLTNEIEERLKLRETIIEIYKTRSKILHHGGSIISESEKSQLNHLYPIARDLLAVLVSRIGEFKNKKALFDWILSQKLTAS